MPPPPATSVRRSSSLSAISFSSTAALPRRNPSHASLSSALTEDRLRKHTCCSSRPYLRSLVRCSPDRDSTGSGSSGKSISSTIFGRLQNLGASCFPMLGGAVGTAAAPPPDPGLPKPGKSSSGKTLRESDLAPAQPAPGLVVPPASAAAEETSAVVEMGYVWADRYRPSALKNFICNRERAEELRQLVSKQHCSHFIFEGSPGVGKRTMVLAFLREVFGPVKLKTVNVLKKIELKGEEVTSIDVNVKISSQHVEVNLSEMSGYEKHVIAAFIKESGSPLNNSENCDHTNCRAIVLHEAEQLSTDAQYYIRWLLEKYKGGCRIFFCCLDASKLQTIKHLCQIVKLEPPSDSEITEVLEFIAKKEHIELPHHLAGKIAENATQNLRQAIRSFEASWKSNFSFKENQEILTGWEKDIAAIARNIIDEQSPKQLYMIRSKLKNLIEYDVSPDFIFSTLIAELKKNLDVHLQNQIDALYREYSVVNPKYTASLLDADQPLKISSNKEPESGKRTPDMRKNVHHFMRIEEFTAKFMSCYKALLTKNAGGTSGY